MTVGTKATTVTFRRPLKLSSFDRQQPVESYRLEIDEEEGLGLSLLAFQLTATMLHTPAISVLSGSHQVLAINSGAPEAALEANARAQPNLSEGRNRSCTILVDVVAPAF
jgi:hypothetical protein